MSESRTFHVKKNIQAGIVNKSLVMLIRFIVRTVFIKKIGAEYLGLNSLFTSVIQVLNMAELGFSSAIVFSLYKPLAEKDNDLVCQLMKFYKTTYKVIGIVVFSVGIIIMPFIKYFVKGEYPSNINIYLVYLLFLLNTVFSYLAFAYKNALLEASQRQDIISNINSFMEIVKGLLQIISLIIWKNYYLYVVWNLIFTICANIAIAWIARKKYPQFVSKGELPIEEKKRIGKQIRGLAIGKIANATRNSFDNVFLSMFCGLISVAIYSNYYYILTAILYVVAIITQAMSASVGNSIATESIEKNYNDFIKFNFYFSWFGSLCFIALICLFQPFMKMWVGESLMTNNVTMLLFCIYFYIMQMGQIRSVYANAAGIWWEIRWLSLLEMFANILLNCILGYLFGMNGILIATIITVFLFSIIGISVITFKCYFKRSYREYFVNLGMYLIITFLVAFLTNMICDGIKVEGILNLIFRIIVVLIVPNVSFLFIAMRNVKHKRYFYYLIQYITHH